MRRQRQFFRQRQRQHRRRNRSVSPCNLLPSVRRSVDSKVQAWLDADPKRALRAIQDAITAREERPRPLVAEAFTGGGLYSIAIAAEGCDVIEVCEKDKNAVKTLRTDLYPYARVCDAREWEPPSGLDILTGGPPCQPWSEAGKLRGPDDHRNMYPRLLKWTDEARPKVCVWENSVKIATNKKFRAYFDWWWGEMDKIGYEGVTYKLVASSYGTPQARKRAFIVAWPKGAPWGEALRTPPPPTHGDPRKKGVKSGKLLPWTRAFDRLASGCCNGYGLHDCENIGNYSRMCFTCVDASNYQRATWSDDEDLTPEAAASVAEVVGKGGQLRMQKHPHAPGTATAWEELGVKSRRVTTWLAQTMVKHLAKGALTGMIATDKTPKFVDIDRDNPAQVKAYIATLKRMSPRAAAKLQDVPAWYDFPGPKTAVYAQVGNGIPVNLGRAVIRHVMDALGYGPIKGSLAQDPFSGLWPMNKVDICGGYDIGALHYMGGYNEQHERAEKRSALDMLRPRGVQRTARPYSNEGGYAKETGRASGWARTHAAWHPDGEYLGVKGWKPASPVDPPPGFGDVDHFLDWVKDESPSELNRWHDLYREVSPRGFIVDMLADEIDFWERDRRSQMKSQRTARPHTSEDAYSSEKAGKGKVLEKRDAWGPDGATYQYQDVAPDSETGLPPGFEFDEEFTQWVQGEDEETTRKYARQIPHLESELREMLEEEGEAFDHLYDDDPSRGR